MTRIEVVNDRLNIEILGWDKLWAFKSRLTFPLEHLVSSRRWIEETDNQWRGIRAPGTSLPGVIVAGTYHGKGIHVFYDVHNFEHAIVLGLRDEWYARVIVEVEDPVSILDLLSSKTATEVAAS